MARYRLELANLWLAFWLGVFSTRTTAGVNRAKFTGFPWALGRQNVPLIVGVSLVGWWSCASPSYSAILRPLTPNWRFLGSRLSELLSGST